MPAPTLTLPPEPAPNSTMADDVFDPAIFAMIDWLSTMTAEQLVALSWVSDRLAEIVIDADRAAAAAAIASAATDAGPWVSADPYVEFNIVISLVEKTPYICILDHTGETVDPVLDAVHWKPFIGDAYAPKLSPAFTGIPTVPTAAPGDDSQQAANSDFVQGELARYHRRAISVAEITTPTDSLIFELTGHEAYQIVALDVRGENNAVNNLLIEFGSDASTFYTSGYTGYLTHRLNETVSTPNDGLRVSVTLPFAGSTNASNGAWLDLKVYPSIDGLSNSYILGQGMSLDASEVFAGENYYNKLTPGPALPVSHIRIRADNGNLATGRFFLYPLAGDTT